MNNAAPPICQIAKEERVVPKLSLRHGPEPEDDINFDEHDKLNRKPFADSLTALLVSFQSPFVISIDAEYGMGKSYFFRMWQNDLQNAGFEVVYLDAWLTDHSNDPFFCLLGTVNNKLEEVVERSDNAEMKTALGKLKEASVSLAFRVGPALAEHALHATAAVDGGATSMVVKAGGAMAKEAITAAIAELGKEQETIDKFRSALHELLSRCSVNEKPLVFVIDELDRCKPSYAIELIEAIKHFFAVEGVVFVLGVSQRQLAMSVKKVYGIDANPEGYVKRIIDFPTELPLPKADTFLESMFQASEMKQFLSQTQHGASDYIYSFRLFQSAALSLGGGFSFRAQRKTFAHLLCLLALHEPVPFQATLATFLLILKNFESDTQKHFPLGTSSVNSGFNRIKKASRGSALAQFWESQDGELCELIVKYSLCSTDQEMRDFSHSIESLTTKRKFHQFVQLLPYSFALRVEKQLEFASNFTLRGSLQYEKFTETL